MRLKYHRWKWPIHASLSRRFNVSTLVLSFLGKIYERYCSTFSKDILCKIFKNSTFSKNILCKIFKSLTFSKNILCKILKNSTFSQYYEEKLVKIQEMWWSWAKSVDRWKLEFVSRTKIRFELENTHVSAVVSFIFFRETLWTLFKTFTVLWRVIG